VQLGSLPCNLLLTLTCPAGDLQPLAALVTGMVTGVMYDRGLPWKLASGPSREFAREVGGSAALPLGESMGWQTFCVVGLQLVT
jgi:hypothetical protein